MYDFWTGVEGVARLAISVGRISVFDVGTNVSGRELAFRYVSVDRATVGEHVRNDRVRGAQLKRWVLLYDFFSRRAGVEGCHDDLELYTRLRDPDDAIFALQKRWRNCLERLHTGRLTRESRLRYWDRLQFSGASPRKVW